MAYSQKYTIAHFIQPVKTSNEFRMSQWPLHVTLADTFAIDRHGSNFDIKLAALPQTLSPATTIAKNDTTLGTANVTLLEDTPSLRSLHLSLVSLLEQNGAIFNHPEFTKDGFLPHCTIQNTERLHEGDRLTVSSLALVDMFPGEDWQQRKILATFPIGGLAE